MCAEMICVNNTHRHPLGVQGTCWLTQESERAKDPFELVEATDPTELIGILAQINGSVVFQLSCSHRGPMQTRK